MFCYFIPITEVISINITSREALATRHDRRGRGIMAHLLALPGILSAHWLILIIPLAMSCAGTTPQHLYHVTSVVSLLCGFSAPRVWIACGDPPRYLHSHMCKSKPTGDLSCGMDPPHSILSISFWGAFSMASWGLQQGEVPGAINLIVTTTLWRKLYCFSYFRDEGPEV